ncbi:MAG: type II secretion system GspH family protein [Gammaproteobacteria bacterium]|nr:type II secretion system GspH family protein [Gammaproteobacteria bacterium]MDH5799969.1 type II secretion system GspH family protein [Gammaproteobacteria bacterium]
MKSRKNAGFSLLEVIVAFSILAMSMVVIANAFSNAIRAAHISSAYLHASTLAQNKLEQLKFTRLTEGVLDGVFETGERWRAVIKPADWSQADLPILAYDINVEVSWGAEGGRTVQLDTVQLVPRL